MTKLRLKEVIYVAQTTTKLQRQIFELQFLKLHIPFCFNCVHTGARLPELGCEGWRYVNGFGGESKHVSGKEKLWELQQYLEHSWKQSC